MSTIEKALAKQKLAQQEALAEKEVPSNTVDNNIAEAKPTEMAIPSSKANKDKNNFKW